MRWRLGKVNEYCGAVSVREDKFADPTQVCSLSFEVFGQLGREKILEERKERS